MTKTITSKPSSTDGPDACWYSDACQYRTEENCPMPTPTKGHRLGGSPAHQRHMMANLATALFEHGKITTTEARARRLRPLAERLITFPQRGDPHPPRQVLTPVTDKDGVHT